MNAILNALLVVVILTNLFALGTGRILAVVRIGAFQGFLLGMMPLLVPGGHEFSHILLALGIMGLKGVFIPFMLFQALREAQIKREVEPVVGPMPSMMLGALATAFAVFFSGQLPLASGDTAPLIIPASFSTVLAGFIILITRLKAISQVMGYIFLENGIFIFGLLLLEAMPFVVEVGVLLDLFVAIFVIGIIVHRINREFSSLDTRWLTSLKE